MCWSVHFAAAVAAAAAAGRWFIHSFSFFNSVGSHGVDKPPISQFLWRMGLESTPPPFGISKQNRMFAISLRRIVMHEIWFISQALYRWRLRYARTGNSTTWKRRTRRHRRSNHSVRSIFIPVARRPSSAACFPWLYRNELFLSFVNWIANCGEHTRSTIWPNQLTLGQNENEWMAFTRNTTPARRAKKMKPKMRWTKFVEFRKAIRMFLFFSISFHGKKNMYKFIRREMAKRHTSRPC